MHINELIEDLNLKNLNHFLKARLDKFLGTNTDGCDLNDFYTGNNLMFEGETILSQAARVRGLEVVERLLNITIDEARLYNIQPSLVDMPNKKRQTPLMIASKNNDLPMVKLLMYWGASVSIQDIKGFSALMIASQWGHLEVAKQLMTQSAALNLQNRSRWTALMLAAQYDHGAIVNELLEHGAIVDVRGPNDTTALIIAARSGRLAIVNLLIAYEATPYMRTTEGETALSVAQAGGYLDTVAILAEDEGWSPFMFAAHEGLYKAVSRLLEAYPNRINGLSKKGNSALILAAKQGHSEVVKLLLEKGARITYPNTAGLTPLMAAVKGGHCEVLTVLFARGAAIEEKGAGGFTPLMLAAQSGQIDATKLLLQRGADLQAESISGLTPLMLAAQAGQIRVVDILLKEGADIEAQDIVNSTALMLAAQAGHSHMVSFLLEKGAQVDAQDTSGSTALVLAAKNGHTSLVELLMAHIAKLEESTFSSQLRSAVSYASAFLRQTPQSSPLLFSMATFQEQGKNALKLAAKNGQKEVVELLLANKAMLDTNPTALMLSAENGHTEITELLLKNNADPNARRTRDGLTALMLASKKGHTDTVDLLLNHKAAINLRSADNCTALTFAATIEKNKAIAKRLIARGSDIAPREYTEDLILYIVRAYLDRKDLENALKAADIGFKQYPNVANHLHDDLANYYQVMWATDGDASHIAKSLMHALKISYPQDSGDVAAEHWQKVQKKAVKLFFLQNPNNLLRPLHLSNNMKTLLSLSGSDPDAALGEAFKEILSLRR